ncbi:MAG: sugar phosphate isomerase/epimerase [Rubrobacteraceae bacterium]
MKLGLFTVPLAEWSLVEVLKYAGDLGCEAVELGAGGYPGNAHCDPGRLLADSSALDKFRCIVQESGLEISALSCHGNPLHPSEDIARAYDENFRNTVRLASELDVETVITFAGCPGDSDNSEMPNWITCAWPPDFREVLEWQWNEKVAPYWRQAADFAGERGVRIAIEPHPGFAVYNAETFWRLKDIAGSNVGVNLDPSNLFWQQIEPIAIVEELGESIFHVHAKDTGFDPHRVARNGVLDTKVHTTNGDRAWVYRVVGRGHGVDFWRALIRELSDVGYEGALSIEHEDLSVDPEEGFREAADLLRAALAEEQHDEQ